METVAANARLHKSDVTDPISDAGSFVPDGAGVGVWLLDFCTHASPMLPVAYKPAAGPFFFRKKTLFFAKIEGAQATLHNHCWNVPTQ